MKIQNMILGIGLVVGLSQSAITAAADPVTYEKDIQPIFKESCFKCHGPDKQKGKLRLDSKEAALKGGKQEKGKIDVVVGKGEASELYQRLITADKDDLMPQNPDGDPVPLSADKIKRIKDWIDQGAK